MGLALVMTDVLGTISEMPGRVQLAIPGEKVVGFKKLDEEVYLKLFTGIMHRIILRH